MTVLAEPSRRITADEFWEMDIRHPGKVELVHGALRMQSYPSGGHGTITANITAAIHNHLLARRSPCRVGNKVGVITTFDHTHNVRRPDIAVTCTPHSKGERAFPHPVLIIEVLSPSNADDTWESMQACSTVGSVQEILAVESETVDVMLFRRDEKGIFPMEPVRYRLGETLHLASLDLDLAVADIYHGTVLAVANLAEGELT